MEAWLLALVDKGGVVALAGIAIWMLNRVWNDRLIEQKRYAESYRELSCKLGEVIEENTKAITVFIDRSRNRSTDHEELKR